eukprot:2410530-Prymnesium_polylepis.1
MLSATVSPAASTPPCRRLTRQRRTARAPWRRRARLMDARAQSARAAAPARAAQACRASRAPRRESR